MPKNLLKMLLILLTCCSFVLLSGCGNISPGTTTSPPTSTDNPPASGTPTLTPTTLAGTHFPACQNVTSVDLKAGSPPANNAVFYVSSQGGIQTSLRGSVLKRYDIASGQTSTLIDYSGTSSVVLGGQISPDKRWLALVAQQDPDHPAALLLIASDGTHVLNIDCNAVSGRPVWSPDGHQLAFASLTQGSTTSIRTVNLTTGAFHVVAQGSYQPLAWADNTHLLVSSSQGDPLSGTKTLSLIDATQGATQHPQTVATAPSICASYTISSDGQHVYSSTCTLAPIANCRSGYGFQGTGSINVQSSFLSGNSTALYNAANLGILALQSSGSSLLFYRYADIGDAGQSGVWLRHADGSLHHLAGDQSQNCLNIEGGSAMPALASNDTSYAFYNGETTKSPLAITVGSLSGNSATTIATLNIGDGMLTLIGMA